jgi:hypothetical protein
LLPFSLPSSCSFSSFAVPLPAARMGNGYRPRRTTTTTTTTTSKASFCLLLFFFLRFQPAAQKRGRAIFFSLLALLRTVFPIRDNSWRSKVPGMNRARHGFRYFCTPLHRVLFIFRSLYVLRYRSRAEVFRLGRRTPPVLFPSDGPNRHTPESGSEERHVFFFPPFVWSAGFRSLPSLPQGRSPFHD